MYLGTSVQSRWTISITHRLKMIIQSPYHSIVSLGEASIGRETCFSYEIEKGRHKKIPRENRFCTLCQNMEVEDEVHFILKCPFITF